MSSSIEQKINEIEDYIESCKFSPLSTSKILVNKEEIEELLEELKLKTPGEIKKYQRMLANKNGILEDAKQRAENIIAEATEQASALVNEHEITQQAYIQGNDLVARAQEEAQKILASAHEEADSVRLNAIEYTDNLLANIQNTITYSMENITMRYEAYMKSLQKTLEMVVANRNELNLSTQPQQSYFRPQPAAEEETELPENENGADEEDYEDYTVEMDTFDEDEE
jgi:hypothetical protein